MHKQEQPQVMSVVDPLTPSSSTVTQWMTKALVWWIVLLVAIIVARVTSRQTSKHVVKHSTRRNRSSTTTIVLCGPLASGKTALTAKLAYGVVPLTHTSMKENEVVITTKSTSTPDNDDSSAQSLSQQQDDVRLERPLRIVDTPGHARLRTRSLAHYLPVADGVAFVIDSTNGLGGKHVREAAEHLHVLLCMLATLVNQRRDAQPIKLLILLSKTDLVPALSSTNSTDTKNTTSLTIERAQQTLLRELEKRRQATSSSTTGLKQQSAGAKLEGLEPINLSTSSTRSFFESPVSYILSTLGLNAPSSSSISSSSGGLNTTTSTNEGLPSDENELLSNSDVAFPFEGQFSEWTKLSDYVDVEWALASVGTIANNSQKSITKQAQLQGFWSWVHSL
ncbi:hypothetical protein OIO90_005698 [Microbotryomycetes sp. JL221]|nr:hypothetical protein OIO90_005698 [Microbotryomycetes sp. JL221]